MPKISRYAGATYTQAAPGETVEDALGRVSALHPEEQEALPLLGEGDENAWLKTDKNGDVVRDDDGNPKYGKQGEVVESKDGEDVSPGDNSSPSTPKQPKSDDEKSDSDRPPARTTESLSGPDRVESSSVRTTGGATTERRQRK